MQIVIGFLIALSVGLTGIGGGSFTTPALVLVSGISGADAVGTALVFSAIVRVTAAPFYLASKHIHFRYLRLMLAGAVPGLLAGTYFLATLNTKQLAPVILVLIGATLVLSSGISFFSRTSPPEIRPDSAPWLPWLTLPIGLETGFSSAGSGALGTMLLLNYSNMPAAQVVGTDLVFGIVLAAVGAMFHFSFGSVSIPALKDLVLGGIPGVLLGCMLAPKVPSRKLRLIIAGIAMLLGVQIIGTGIRVWYKRPDVQAQSKPRTSQHAEKDNDRSAYSYR